MYHPKNKLNGYVDTPQKLVHWNQVLKTVNPCDQRIRYDNDIWSKTFINDPDFHELIEKYPNSITRGDLKQLSMETQNDDKGDRKLFLATMIWGFGRNGYGPYRTYKMLTDVHAITTLHKTVLLLKNGELSKAYQDFSLNSCGPSFMSKFFYAVGLGINLDPLPLVLDSRVAKALLTLSKECELKVTDLIRYSINKKGDITLQKYPEGYVTYVQLMNLWSKELDCQADAIELFLFDPPKEFWSVEINKNIDTKQNMCSQLTNQQKEIAMEKLNKDFSCEYCSFSIKKLREMSELAGSKEMFTTFRRQNKMNIYEVNTENVHLPRINGHTERLGYNIPL